MTVKEIILHCTDTPAGRHTTVAEVDNWHKHPPKGSKMKPMKKIGYHFLIYLDGSIHRGRAENEVGGHCIGHNYKSLGVCYVGGHIVKNGKRVRVDTRTEAQKKSLISLVKQLMKKYNLTAQDIHCHYEFASHKACPCFKIEDFRRELRGDNSNSQNVTIYNSNIPANTSNTKNLKQTSTQTSNVSTSPYKKFKKGWLGGKTKWYIASPMGHRKPPKPGASSDHGGNDISTPTGTKIYAPCDGNVIRRHQGRGKGGGLYVILQAPSGYWFYFMHLSKVIKTGPVKEGDLIAETGGDPRKDPENAGRSTGPHLHFEVRKNGDKSQRVDGKYFVSDTWISKRTGKTITSSSNTSIPLITENKSNYTEEQQRAAFQEYTINFVADQVPIEEQDVSGETTWEETEIEDNGDEEEKPNTQRATKEKLVPGIWQIMKLVMDADVANLRIRDAATSLQQGSLINFFQKVCQQPFVEFFGDTYGDQYYFITRRPPFDKEGMKKTMVAQGLFDPATVLYENKKDNKNNYNGKNVDSQTIYDIYEDDIVSSNISFNNQNIYSWYQFIPIYELGSPSELQYLIPAVLFPEYAAIWGSRSLNIRSQYRNFRNSNISDKVKNGENSEQGDVEVRHSIHDLKYIIESNAYNPFVRQGTITILGNRRIKRGTFIRVFWNSLDCPEIFYVESVNQNYSVGSNAVHRTTSLTLSHGMLSNYMFDNAVDSIKIGLDDKKNEKDKVTISYFNIIDFGNYEADRDYIDMNKWREVISSWKVNKTVFMYFLRKTHFLQHLSEVTVEDIKKDNIL